MTNLNKELSSSTEVKISAFSGRPILALSAEPPYHLPSFNLAFVALTNVAEFLNVSSLYDNVGNSTITGVVILSSGWALFQAEISSLAACLSLLI